LKVIETLLPGVLVLEPTIFEDPRGFFMETFNAGEFASVGLPTEFVQDNHSLSREKGTLRGLHYQVDPKAQGKLVRCLRGAILDVAVDIRKKSPKFKKWVAEIISAENKRQLWVPPGFAHGFVTLETDTEVVYKVTDLYSPAHDRVILWNDPEINIDWQISAPILSAKDAAGKSLRDADLF
jgi:dTDP-4-dehydrorhamnose 3,5-epimerase